MNSQTLLSLFIGIIVFAILLYVAYELLDLIALLTGVGGLVRSVWDIDLILITLALLLPVGLEPLVALVHLKLVAPVPEWVLSFKSFHIIPLAVALCILLVRIATWPFWKHRSLSSGWSVVANSDVRVLIAVAAADASYYIIRWTAPSMFATIVKSPIELIIAAMQTMLVWVGFIILAFLIRGNLAAGGNSSRLSGEDLDS